MSFWEHIKNWIMIVILFAAMYSEYYCFNAWLKLREGKTDFEIDAIKFFAIIFAMLVLLYILIYALRHSLKLITQQSIAETQIFENEKQFQVQKHLFDIRNRIEQIKHKDSIKVLQNETEIQKQIESQQQNTPKEKPQLESKSIEQLQSELEKINEEINKKFKK